MHAKSVKTWGRGRYKAGGEPVFSRPSSLTRDLPSS
jgi:hypothetical protein